MRPNSGKKFRDIFPPELQCQFGVLLRDTQKNQQKSNQQPLLSNQKNRSINLPIIQRLLKGTRTKQKTTQ